MNGKVKISASDMVKKINAQMKKHDLYQSGMMVEMVPKSVRSTGYTEVIKMPNIEIVLGFAVNEVNKNFIIDPE
jgi:outer membrane protease